MTLEERLYSLIQRALDRRGRGFGTYPLGVRDAVAELLPLANQDYRARNGYGQELATLREHFARLERELGE
jgi:hypothetical protein